MIITPKFDIPILKPEGGEFNLVFSLSEEIEENGYYLAVSTNSTKELQNVIIDAAEVAGEENDGDILLEHGPFGELEMSFEGYTAKQNSSWFPRAIILTIEEEEPGSIYAKNRWWKIIYEF